MRFAVAGDPEDGEARRALGLILRQKGDLSGAAAELRRSVALRPRDAQGHNVLGSVLERQGELPEAMDEFRTATLLEPGLTEARVNLAQALKKAGREGEARAELVEIRRQKTVESARSRAMVLLETAEAALESGDAPRAVQDLTEATSLSPDFAEAHFRLGLALERAGRPAAESEAAFVSALRLDLDHSRARWRFGLSLARHDRSEAAFQLRRALETAPSLVDARRDLARLSAEAGDWKAASSELKAVVAWEPGDARSREALAAALEALGDSEGAALERAATRAGDRGP